MITRWEFWTRLARRDPSFTPLIEYWRPADEMARLDAAAEPMFRREARKLCKAAKPTRTDPVENFRLIMELRNPCRRIIKAREAAGRRNAAKLNATPPWFGELDEFVMREAADLCRLRELATGFAWQVDHMVPLQAKLACGLHCASNLQVIPARLNAIKGNRMILDEPDAWLMIHGEYNQ